MTKESMEISEASEFISIRLRGAKDKERPLLLTHLEVTTHWIPDIKLAGHRPCDGHLVQRCQT